MTPSNPTDLFLINHQFKTDLMINTIAQVVKGLHDKGVAFSEGAMIDLSVAVWEDSLSLIQEGKTPTEVRFYIDGDDSIEIN